MTVVTDEPSLERPCNSELCPGCLLLLLLLLENHYTVMMNNTTNTYIVIAHALGRQSVLQSLVALDELLKIARRAHRSAVVND